MVQLERAVEKRKNNSKPDRDSTQHPVAPKQRDVSNTKKAGDTSWQSVAPWYDLLLETDANSFQEKVILPNLMRLMSPAKGEKILDIACGQGFFSRALSSTGAQVTGTDLSKDLIEIAKSRSQKSTDSTASIEYHVLPAHEMSLLQSHTFNKAVIVLALQNIKQAQETLTEAARLLKSEGKLWIVLNHPVFRIPKLSSWGFDDVQKKQYRRLDAYMSEASFLIDMHPGKKDAPQTISFHRPLQWYFKAFQKAGFSTIKLEEWISHRESQKGPRKAEEDRLRSEIPMFMCVELRRLLP